ncbi:hypothetical protein TWF281_007639 [Arthrobotrys megalospora]
MELADCEYENFIIWGVQNGFCKTDVDGQVLALQPPDVPEKLKRGLNLIEQLLTDADSLRKKYGIEQLGSNADANNEGVEDTESEADLPAKKKRRTVSAKNFKSDAIYPSNSALKRIKWWKTREQPTNPKLDLLRKSMWAINDRDKFERLVKDIHDLIESLYKILPVDEKERNALAAEDIKSLSGDLEGLKLFEEASGTHYPEWSSRASIIIEVASSIGKKGPGTISQWMANLENETESDLYTNKPWNTSSSLPKQQGIQPLKENTDSTNRFTFKTSGYLKWIFAFTTECRAAAIGSSCETERLEITPSGPSFIFDNDIARQWGLKNRIDRIVDAQGKHLAKLESWTENWSGLELQDALIGSSYPAVIINIYCPPCRCSLKTALSICSSSKTQKLSQYRVRVDDRLPASCCTNSDNLRRMRSIAKTSYDLDDQLLKRNSRSSISWESLENLDRLWLEQRIYDLEERAFVAREPMAAHQQINDFLVSISDPEEIGDKINSVVILEATQGAWILQSQPFPWTPIPPKENQIFLLSRTTRDQPTAINVKYHGTFTAHKPVAAYSNQFDSKKRSSPGSIASVENTRNFMDIGQSSTSGLTANLEISPPSSINFVGTFPVKRNPNDFEFEPEEGMGAFSEYITYEPEERL